LPAFELLLVQRRVQPAVARQVAVRARFRDPAAVGDVDGAGVDDGGQPAGGRFMVRPAVAIWWAP
jgi:hypothetical protein